MIPTKIARTQIVDKRAKLTIRLPRSDQRRLRRIALEQETSIQEFVCIAVLKAMDAAEKRARKGTANATK